jgi:hypothetical protein
LEGVGLAVEETELVAAAVEETELVAAAAEEEDGIAVAVEKRSVVAAVAGQQSLAAGYLTVVLADFQAVVFAASPAFLRLVVPFAAVLAETAQQRIE